MVAVSLKQLKLAGNWSELGEGAWSLTYWN